MGNSEPVAKRRRTRRAISAEREYNVAGPSNQESEAENIPIGRIDCLHLINFMCHANTVVKFNKNINIFLGCNGSGKSAIITAIVIGLGGNAAAAERSKNIAQLIRRGEKSATIEITLHNEGNDSYEYDNYGDRIIVQRQISASGASQYRIKSKTGVVVTKSLSDLQKMLMYMNIQVNNPICVLNQDAARSFLKDSDPNRCYSLFAKATQIEKIIGLYQNCALSFKISQSKCGVLEQKLEKTIKYYTETKNHYERLMSVETLKEELRKLKIELEWCKVKEEETKYEAMSNKLVELDGKIEELKQSISRWDDDLKRFNEEKKNLMSEIKDIKATIAANLTNYDSLRSSRGERRSQLSQQETKHKGMLDKLKRLKKEINEMQTSIDDRQTSNRVELLKRSNEEKLQNLSAQREEIRSTENNTLTSIQLLDSKAQEAKSTLDDLQHKHQVTKQNMEKIKNDIKQINVKSDSSLTIFGSYMPKLIATLEQHYKRGKFSELPRGPIGRYVQVKNPKWSPLVEHILGGQLQYFIFNTLDDSKYFDSLIKSEFKQAKINISKIVTKFCHTPHDVRANKVKLPRGDATILQDEIIVSDPVVMNVMIDQIHIEAIVMCSNTEEASKYTINQAKVPKNLLKIFSLDPTAEYHPAPNFRSYGISVRPCRLLQTDMKQYKEQLELELVEATKEFEAVQLELAKCRKAVAHCNDQLAKQKANLLKIEEKLRLIQNNISEIENFEYPAQHEVDVLQNELNELQNEYGTTVTALEREKQDAVTLKEQLQTIEKDIKVNQANAKTMENTLKDKMNQIDGITEKIDNLAMHNVEADLRTCEIDRKKIITEASKQEKLLEEVTHQATEKGERIDKNRATDKIKKLISTTENKIQNRCASTDDITTVKTLMLEQEKAYKSIQESLANFKDALNELEVVRDARYGWLFHVYRPYVSLRIKNKFGLMLKLRKFGGELHMKHEDHTLEINIVPQDKNNPYAVSNTKSLSGGERSFSTLALLISLWSCVSSPFYFLDEYDVFTDQINRRIMAQLLISEAKRQPLRQFCFFTPQDMSFVDESESITFHKLENHLKPK